jgi:hypothetical protein
MLVGGAVRLDFSMMHGTRNDVTPAHGQSGPLSVLADEERTPSLGNRWLKIMLRLAV